MEDKITSGVMDRGRNKIVPNYLGIRASPRLAKTFLFSIFD
jgi:hypothetical protein